MHKTIFCFFLISCLLIAAPEPLPEAQAIAVPTTPTPLLQFTSGGHVLGFGMNSVYAANSTHAYRVEFIDANPISPVSQGSTAQTGQALPLEQVTYSGLWDGITLTYDRPEGALLHSTYQLEPYADPTSIQLQYNTPVNLEANGILTLAFANGTMTESAPIAWQEKDGERVSVDVAYTSIGKDRIGFELGAYDPAQPLTIDPWLTWTTFLGTEVKDVGTAIAVDLSGSIYLAGYTNGSFTTIPAPRRNYTGDGGADAFVVKLDDDGDLIWHSYLGALGEDRAGGIALYNNSVFVTGQSHQSWAEAPIRAHAGNDDSFVAKLDRDDGGLIWHTFLGSDSDDSGKGITVNASGEAFVVGHSENTWGAPKRSYFGSGTDAFVAKLNDDGTLDWNTFLGGAGVDQGKAITLDGSGGVYLTGSSSSSWGNAPVRLFTAGDDAFVAKLAEVDGDLTWHTFLGGDLGDIGEGVAFAGGGVFVIGTSEDAWGAGPVEAHHGGDDSFVAMLNPDDGTLSWHTFVGGEQSERGYAIAALEDVTEGITVVITGRSDASWGSSYDSPRRLYAGQYDGFVAKLDGTGALTWHTFLGGEAWDSGLTLALDSNGDVFTAGESRGDWAEYSLNLFIGRSNAFIARLNSNGNLVSHNFLSVRTGDEGRAIAVDANNEIFVTGMSRANWLASPVRLHTGDSLVDAFVAKLDEEGELIWHTFLGAAGEDVGYGIVLDGTGGVYVTGYSKSTWGSPLHPLNKSGKADAFVAKLNGADGALIWHTFLGGMSTDIGFAITLDENNRIYIAGQSEATWDITEPPVRSYTGDADAFVARLANNGVLEWHTFLGGTARDLGSGITADGSGAVYLVGRSNAPWVETPVNAHFHTNDDKADAFVAKLNRDNGEMAWHIFLGGTDTDWGSAIAASGDGAIFVAGRSHHSWGENPVRAHADSVDGFVAKIDGNGALLWHTFLGGDSADWASAIAARADGSLYVTGLSNATWGMPAQPYNGAEDVFVLKLNRDGALVQNTFIGGGSSDEPFGIALADDGAYYYVTGRSDLAWGSPTPSQSLWRPLFIAKLEDSYQTIFPLFYQ